MQALTIIRALPSWRGAKLGETPANALFELQEFSELFGFLDYQSYQSCCYKVGEQQCREKCPLVLEK